LYEYNKGISINVRGAEALREALKAKSVEEVIRRFLKERRQRILEEVFGLDRGG